MTQLITLKGSEKQVAWANKIRQELLPGIEQAVEDSANDKNTPAEMMTVIRQAHQNILNQPQAKWWIEHRGEMPKLVLREVYLSIMSGK